MENKKGSEVFELCKDELKLSSIWNNSTITVAEPGCWCIQPQYFAKCIQCSTCSTSAWYERIAWQRAQLVHQRTSQVSYRNLQRTKSSRRVRWWGWKEIASRQFFWPCSLQILRTNFDIKHLFREEKNGKSSYNRTTERSFKLEAKNTIELLNTVFNSYLKRYMGLRKYAHLAAV